ncbi:hypothetical protein F9K50_02030 [bacterium]|nr:MAG: hypothetical protein F9K50_02030 [bacterium]
MIDTDNHKGQSKGQLLLSVIVNFLVMFGLFSWLTFTRNVDGDEGLYLEAARLVAGGKRLYADFFFQQMPLLPYLYAGWTEVFGFSLFSGRLFSALLTALSGTVALVYAAVAYRRVFLVNLVALLMYGCGIFLAWAPVIKTHPFNAFFLVSSSVLLMLWGNGTLKGSLYLTLAGLLIGLGISCRLTLAPFPFLFLLYIMGKSERPPFRLVGSFLMGLLLGLLPCLVFWYWTPELFWKYNLAFHTDVFPGVSAPSFRAQIAKSIFAAPQIAILFVLGYISLLRESQKGWEKLFFSDQLFLTALIALFFAIHLAAAMPFTQYFSAVIPWLALASLPLLELALRWGSAFRNLIFAPLAVGYIALAAPFYERELSFVGSLNPEWRLENILSAVKALKRIVKPGDSCLTWWPGYTALAGCQLPSGMENHMREHAILRGISSRKLKEYRLLPAEDLLVLLDEKKVRVVVDGAYRLQTPFDEFAEYLIQENYQVRSKRGGVKIYTLATERELAVEEKALAAVKPLHDLERKLISR